MAEATLEPTWKRHVKLRHRVLNEAHLRLHYAEAAERAAEDGLVDLFEEFAALADRSKENHDALKSEAEELQRAVEAEDSPKKEGS